MITQFSIDFNRDYGEDRRTGWSIVIDGVCVAQIEPRLVVALWRAFNWWWRYGNG